MREEFFGYYKPTEDEYREIWQKCIFVFDANILLNLYRYSSKTSNQFIKILEFFTERVWMTHQAALEYQDKRLLEIAQQEKIFRVISEKLDTVRREIEGVLSKGHLSIAVDEVMKKLESTFEKVKIDLQNHQEKHPNLFVKDDIREKITKIFAGKVGASYSEARLSEIYKIGESRYALEVPPGYKDKNKGDKKKFGDVVIESRYGDLIQWFQMLDKATMINLPIVFVTDDTKEDWWWIVNGKTIGPRPELVTEMKIKAGVLFCMYQPEQFINYANELYRLKISKAIMEEVREVEESKADWKNLVISALEYLEGEGDLAEIYEHVERNSVSSLPKTWRSQVRRALYSSSSDCEIYSGKEDLFLHVGKGRWALRGIKD